VNGSIMRLFGWITAGTGLILLPIAVWLATAPPADMTASDTTLSVLVVGGLSAVSLLVGGPLAVIGHLKVTHTRQVLRDGFATEGMITDLRASLTEINEQPMTIIEMAVRRPDGTMAPARLKVLVPMVFMNSLRPGLALPVRLDPERLDFVVIDWNEARRRMFAAVGVR
jgi:hypothetical protein